MPTKRPNLSNDNMSNIAQYLHLHYKSGILARGKINETATLFGVSRRTISSIWSKARQLLDVGLPLQLQSQKKGSIKRKKDVFDAERVKAIPVQLRTTYRKMGKELGVDKNTVMRWKKEKLLRPHTNSLKPGLSDIAKLKRLKFCLQALQVVRTHDDRSNGDRTHDDTEFQITFKSMQHILHVDEKWFNIKKECERHYLTQEEEEAYRACQNKNFILKVMFLCVVGRPIYDAEGNLLFDGKIGMFPFTHKVPARRSSINRPAGTLETKPIESITKQVMKDFMINKVVPAIKAKWPMFESTNIIIQQDNARPHFLDDDADFRAVASSDGFNIHLGFQPASSPDLNVNDLGWFMALQTLQLETRAYTTDELVAAVDSSFQALEPYKLNRVYLTLQACMVEIMKQRGHNTYKLPHMKKDALERQGKLPIDIVVDKTLVKECIDYLVQKGEATALSELMEAMGYDANPMES